MMPSRAFHLIAPLAATAAMLASLAATPVASAQAADAPPAPGGKLYRWVDKDKTVHYSDRPQPGADTIDVRPAQTYSKPPSATGSATRNAAPRQGGGPAVPRIGCTITAPTPEQVFPNVQSVMITYRGPADGTAQLQLGGSASTVLSAPAGQAFTIAPIARGTYTATVTVNGDSGVELCRTQTVTFHVRQPSVLSPVRQQMNRAPRAN